MFYKTLNSQIYRGQVFKFAIAAAELSDKEEYVNAFQARISVEPAEKPESM